MLRLYRKGLKYFGARPLYCSIVHVIAGIGIGFLLTYTVAGIHPVRWGLVFIGIAILGHLRAIL